MDTSCYSQMRNLFFVLVYKIKTIDFSIKGIKIDEMTTE